MSDKVKTRRTVSYTHLDVYKRQRRTYVGKVKLYVPKEKWLNRLLSYGALKISYDKTLSLIHICGMT